MAKRGKKVLGRLETVRFPRLTDGIELVAKIDTGADSGALHCVFERLIEEKDGERWLEFQPINEDQPIVRTDKFKRIIVRSSNGIPVERHRIETTVLIQGKEYEIELTLWDRSSMKYDVLIGHKFLKDKFLVDVSQVNV